METVDVAPAAVEAPDVESNSQPATPAVPKHSVKVDGQDLELDIEELKKGYQLASSSTKRFQEASQQMKQMQELMELAKANPEALFEHLGLDPIKFSEDKLLAKLEEDSLSPEQKEHRALKRELDKYKTQETKNKEAAAKVQQEKDFAAAADAVDKEIMDALTKSGAVPSAKLIANIAEYMMTGLSAEQALAKADKFFRDTKYERWETMDEENLLSELPPALLARIRSADVKKAKNLAKPTAQAATKERAKGEKARSFEDFFRNLPKGD